MITPSKEFLEVFKNTDGALSCAESIAIMNIAAQANELNGLWFEFGTYKGKSAMAAAFGMDKPDKSFWLVDPIFEDWNSVLLIKGNQILNNTCKAVAWADLSINVIPQYDNYAYVFVDSGSHQDGLPMQEVKLLEDRIVKDGIIAFHDFRSQFKEVEEAYNYLLGTGKFEEIKINWDEIIEYVNQNNL